MTSRESTSGFDFWSRGHLRMAMMVVWLSGNALASINVVALRQTQLVLGWVTMVTYHFGM